MLKNKNSILCYGFNNIFKITTIIKIMTTCSLLFNGGNSLDTANSWLKWSKVELYIITSN